MAANEQLESVSRGRNRDRHRRAESAPGRGASAREGRRPRQRPSQPPSLTQAKPEPEDEADAEPTDRLEQDGKSYIPQQVLERERQRRQDWKARAVEAETKHKELQRQLDEATAPRYRPATAATGATTAAAGPGHQPAGLGAARRPAAAGGAAQRAAQQLRDDAGR